MPELGGRVDDEDPMDDLTVAVSRLRDTDGFVEDMLAAVGRFQNRRQGTIRNIVL